MAKGKARNINTKPFPIIERKLGREQADGQAFDPALGDKVRKLEIDPRLKGKEWLETFIHELLHLCCPGMCEEDVLKVSKFLSRYLWFMGVRRIYK